MPRRRYDYMKPCSWCNICPSSMCDCGPCNDDKCTICKKPSEKTEVVAPKDRYWRDEDSEGAGGDGEL